MPVTRVRHYLLHCLLLMLAWVTLLPVTPARAALDIVQIPVGKTDIALSSYFSVYEDPFHVGTLNEDPASLLNQIEWTRHDDDIFNPGVSDSTWWLAVTLHNSAAFTLQRELVIYQPTLDSVTLWQIRDDMAVNSLTIGDAHPFSARPVRDRNLVFPILLPPNRSTTLLLKVRSRDTLQVPAILMDAETYAGRRANDELFRGLMFGMFSLVLTMSTFMFFIHRERLYGWYVLHIASQMGIAVTLLGFGMAYLWPDSPGFQHIALNMSLPCASIFAVNAVDSLLNFRHHFSRSHWLLPVTYGTTLILAIITIFSHDPYYIRYMLISIVIGVTPAAVMTTILVFRRHRDAILVEIGWTILFLASLYEIGQYLGMFPFTRYTLYSLQIGALIEILLFAYLISTWSGDERQQKLAAQDALIASQQEATRVLEARVEERTRELNEAMMQLGQANQVLQAMNITDALTNIFNRRFFDSKLDEEIRRAERAGQPLTLLMFDIDHFKRFNDSWGHKTGDRCLQVVASTIQQRLRQPPDMLCRYGGEEFAVIAPLTGQTGAMRLADDLCRAIAGMDFCNDAGERLQVTISIGIFCLPPGQHAEADTMVIRADEALYEAKRAGRNRWRLWGQHQSTAAATGAH